MINDKRILDIATLYKPKFPELYKLSPDNENEIFDPDFLKAIKNDKLIRSFVKGINTRCFRFPHSQNVFL